MKPHVLCSLIPLLGLSAHAKAWHFECRFIERVGTLEIIVPGPIDASNGVPRNIRLQFGVFDDADGPAPAGGLVGWNVGSLSVSGAADNSDERRNNGRLSPFNFASSPNSNGNPPLPNGDPFTMLTEIDATLGTQSPNWLCDANGEPLPMPQPVSRGINTFVSVFAFQIDPNPGAAGYSITAAGNLIAATEWRTIGTPIPPDCEPDPGGPLPGGVTYAPFPTDPRSFACSLVVLVPSPLTGPLLGAAVVACAGRRRCSFAARSI